MAENNKRGRGRPPGAKNRRTEERAKVVAATAEQLQTVIDGCFEGDAHALLMAVYKDSAHEWQMRIDAAKAAIRYEKPSLSSIEAKVDARVDGLVGIEWRIVDPVASSA